MCEWSSLGDRGTGLAGDDWPAAVAVATPTAPATPPWCGRRSDWARPLLPRWAKPTRLGVTGRTGVVGPRMVLSSLEARRAASMMSGEGDSLVPGVPPPSERDLVLNMGDGSMAESPDGRPPRCVGPRSASAVSVTATSPGPASTAMGLADVSMSY